MSRHISDISAHSAVSSLWVLLSLGLQEFFFYSPRFSPLSFHFTRNVEITQSRTTPWITPSLESVFPALMDGTKLSSRWECTKSMQMDYFFMWWSNMNMDIQLYCLGVIREGDAETQRQEGQYVLPNNKFYCWCSWTERQALREIYFNN